GKPLRYGLCGRGPVARFGSAEQKAKAKKGVKAARKRSQQRNQGVPGDRDAQAAFRAHAIHQPAAERLTDGIGSAESNYDGGVIGVRPVIVALQKGCEKRQRLAIDIIDHRGGKQDSSNPPAQRRNGAPPNGMRWVVHQETAELEERRAAICQAEAVSA